MDNKCFFLCLVLQGKVEDSKTSHLILSMGLLNSWGWCQAGQGAGWRRNISPVHYTRLSESGVRRRQFQVRGAPHLLVMVVKWLRGKVAIQIPFLQVQMKSLSGFVWTGRKFTVGRWNHQRCGVAVSINVGFTGVVGCCRGRSCKLLLATEAFWVDVDPFEHMHKLIGGCLLRLCVFTLAADPSEARHGKDKSKDAHHSNTHWHCDYRGWVDRERS